MPDGPAISTDLPTPRCALAIAAHPDDVEFGCGATFARWASDGCGLVHVICTDGSKGTWDTEADLTELVARRRDEQRDASLALGGAGVVEFIGRVDGELAVDRATTAELVAIIRRHRPDIVIAHDPWKRYRLHPDHRAAGFLALDAVVAARDPHFFPEQGLAPHRPTAILLFEADEVDHVESATPETLAARCSALEAHRSQMETTHFFRLDGDADSLQEFRDRERSKLADMGAVSGLALGEAFHLITDT